MTAQSTVATRRWRGSAVVTLAAMAALAALTADAALFIIRLMPGHFANSDHLEAQQQIQDDLTWVEAGLGHESNIDATIKRMIDDDVRKAAEAILGLYHKLSGGWRD